jgi:hypothetical protein
MVVETTFLGNQGHSMTRTRAVVEIGLTLMSVALPAAPAFAKGGGDINNTVISVAPGVTPAPTGGGKGGSGGGGGGGTKCVTVSIDPVTGVGTGICGKFGA